MSESGNGSKPSVPTRSNLRVMHAGEFLNDVRERLIKGRLGASPGQPSMPSNESSARLEAMGSNHVESVSSAKISGSFRLLADHLPKHRCAYCGGITASVISLKADDRLVYFEVHCPRCGKTDRPCLDHHTLLSILMVMG